MTLSLALSWDEENDRLRALGAARFVLGYEPARTRYQDLLGLGLRFCGYALLVMQPQFEWSARATTALDILAPWLLSELTGTEWPGTRVTDPTKLLVYDFEPGFVDGALSITRRLFQWEQPELPEDLCLFRRSGEPWLATIAHERDAWLNLTASEIPAVAEALRPIPLRRARPQ